jgi:hypothetical protein
MYDGIGPYTAFFALHENPYINVSLDVLQAVSDEHQRIIGERTLEPCFMLDFRQTMDDHSRSILRDGVPIGTLLWHDGFTVSLNAQGNRVNVALPIGDINQILRQRDAILATSRR